MSGRSVRANLLRALVAAVGVTAGGLAGALPASAETGQAIGVAPAPGATGLSSGGNYFSPTVAAGGTFSSTVLLANPNTEAVQVVLYGVDGVTSAGSGSTYSNQGQPLTGPGTWIQLDKTSMTLGALSRTTVGFTVHTPSSATPGDHLGGVAIEGVKPSANAGGGAVRVKILTRSVIGVLIRIPGDAQYGMKIGTPSLSSGAFRVGEVNSLLTNTGGLLVRPFVVDRLQGPNGYDKSITRALDTILPGTSTTYSLFWPTPLEGKYTITSCVYGGGLNEKVCSSGSGELAVASQTPTHNNGAFPAHKSSGFPVGLLIVLIALGAIVLIGGGALVGVRYARKKIAAAVANAVGKSPGDATADSADNRDGPPES